MAESEIKLNLQRILNERQKKAGKKHGEVEALSQMRKDSLEKLDLIYDKFNSLSPTERANICDKESRDCLESIPQKRERLRASFDQAIQELTALETRFSRSTVNLVVIGAMGAGKSKFLQSASGLSDECIPSYSYRSCTGVTSIIENSDAETEAVFTFKTLREVTEEMDREIQNFAARLHVEDKMVKVFNIADGIQNLNTLKDVLSKNGQKIIDVMTGTEREVKGADKEDISDLLEIYDTQRSSWEKYLADAVAGDLDPALSVQETNGIKKYVLRQKSKIEEYVSKHNKDSTKKYYKYVAIKKAVIRTKFPGSIDANIQLIDTVGIGDPAVDTEKRMMEAIQDEADGVIFILEGTDRYENHVIKDELLIKKFQEIYNSYRNRAGGGQKETRYWMAFLVNSRPKEGAAIDYGQKYLESTIIPSFDGRGGVFGEGGIELKKAINVGKSEEVEKMLSEFLKQISDHLKEIDAGLEKDAAKAAGHAVAQNKEFMDQLGGVRTNSINTALTNSMNRLRTECMKVLTERLCIYADQEIRGAADNITSISFLQQSLAKVRLLKDGNALTEFTFGPKIAASLEEMIDYYASSAGYPKDPDSARIAVFQTLQSIVRDIGSRPPDDQRNLETAFKERIADLFVDTLQLDCLKLGDGQREALNTSDPHFFSKVSQKLLVGLENTGDIQKAFQSLDQFKLDNSNVITKALFNYYSAEYLRDTPYEEKDMYVSKDATRKDLLLYELDQKLEQFIQAINARTNNETYLVAESEQMYGELVNFINVLGPKYEAAWKDIFSSMVEQSLLLSGAEQQERLNDVAAIAEEIEALLKNLPRL